MAAKPPAQVEVDGDETVTLEWGGHTYEVPASLEDCDIEVLEAFEAGKAAAAVSGVLGRAQWAQLKARSKPKVRDLADLMDKVAEVYGFQGSGE